MKEKRKYWITGALSLGTTAAHVAFRGFPGQNRAQTWQLLCDGFAVPGLLCLLLWALLAVQQAGALDGLGYLLRAGIRRLFPGQARAESYGAYRRKREAKSVRSLRPWLLAGAGDLAAAAVFLALYGAAI